MPIDLMGPVAWRRLVAAALVLFLCAVSLVSTSELKAAPNRQELEEAEERLHELEKDFELVVERYNATREELLEIQAKMAAARLVVEDIQKRMDARQGDAIALAQELYMSGGATVALESILAAETMSEVDTAVQYLRASEEAQAQVFETLAVDRAELNRHLAQLEEDRTSAAAAEERLSSLRVEIEAKVESQEEEIAELNEAIEAAARRRAEAARQAAEAQAESAVPTAPLSVPARPAPAPNASAQTAVDAALSQVGKPYRWAAAGPDAYDCSGLTMWAWAQAGVALPHNSGMQQASITPVSQSDLQPGDLIFFGSPVHHVAMYIGNGQMVEAPYTGQFVRVVSASRSDYAGAGRPGV
jgi:cell wall-associated NlpC family hydrolase